MGGAVVMRFGDAARQRRLVLSRRDSLAGAGTEFCGCKGVASPVIFASVRKLLKRRELQGFLRVRFMQSVRKIVKTKGIAETEDMKKENRLEAGQNRAELAGEGEFRSNRVSVNTEKDSRLSLLCQ